jgi:hypothetical protein
MRRLMLVLLLAISIYLVQGANDFATCNAEGGVKLCDSYYCCGVEDGICPETWGATCDEANKDPDCSERGCTPQCTNRQGECDIRCNGENGCIIPDIHINITENSYFCENLLPGVLVDYNETHELECCIGNPVKTIEVTFTNMEDFDKTLVKYTKLVNYKGKPVRMVMVVWG